LTHPAPPTESDPATDGRPASRWAIPLLGAIAGIQGADPNIASTALVGVSRGLDMAGGLLALAASISTLALSASVIYTGLLADRLGRRRVLMAALALARWAISLSGSPRCPLSSCWVEYWPALGSARSSGRRSPTSGSSPSRVASPGPSASAAPCAAPSRWV
jgi:MFS family permease